MRRCAFPASVLGALLVLSADARADAIVDASTEAPTEATPAAALPEADQTPVAMVDDFHATLLGVMQQAESLSVQERFVRLEPAVTRAFDLEVMLRIASGTHWAKADDATRAKAAAAFEKLSVATYADRFNGFSGQSFETLGTKPGPRKTTLVLTRLNRPKEEPVELVYVFRELEGRWAAIDVLLAGGVSELARYRSDYKKTLADRGLAGLAVEIEAKAAATLGE